MVDPTKTKEVANKLVELCRKGDWEGATNELYADNIVSLEPEGANGPQRIEGIEGKRQKDKMFAGMVEEFHSNVVSEPLVAGNHFSIEMTMDATFKEMGRVQMAEICVYRVNAEGKIDLEQFFFPTQPQG